MMAANLCSRACSLFLLAAPLRDYTGVLSRLRCLTGVLHYQLRGNLASPIALSLVEDSACLLHDLRGVPFRVRGDRDRYGVLGFIKFQLRLVAIHRNLGPT